MEPLIPFYTLYITSFKIEDEKIKNSGRFATLPPEVIKLIIQKISESLVNKIFHPSFTSLCCTCKSIRHLAYQSLTHKQIQQLFMFIVRKKQMTSEEVLVIQTILEQKLIMPDTQDNLAIREASKNGHADLVKLLLKFEVDPAANGNEALKLASENGHADVVNLLLTSTHVDPAADNNYALLEASKNGHAEVVKCLLASKKVDTSVNRHMPIKWASYNGWVNVVKLFLEESSTNSVTHYKRVVKWASINRHKKVIELIPEAYRVPSAAQAYCTIL